MRWSHFKAHLVETFEHVEASKTEQTAGGYEAGGYDPPSLRERLDIPWGGEGPDPRGAGREGVLER